MTTERDWERLNKDYRKNGIALALGAGVSAGCNLPNWRDLLERIAICCYGRRGKKRFQEMLKDGYPLPAMAGILEADCPKGWNFTEVIRDALYKKFPYYESKGKKFDSEKFQRFVRAKNQTLSAVAALCAVKQRSEFYAANPRIHAIVNSNFDATLREYARARYTTSKKVFVTPATEPVSCARLSVLLRELSQGELTCTTCTDSSSSAKADESPAKRLPISECSASRITSTFQSTEQLL